MASNLWKGQAFSVSHADGSGTQTSQFEGGLRAFFEYRDLGVNDATKGKFIAHVIRAVPGRHAEPKWHVHHLDFQMVYILQGWVVFEYEGQGEVTLRKGTSVLQPPASGIERLAIVMILSLLKSARLPSLKPSW